MITEDRGLTMLAGANPVPQLDLIDVDVEAAKYLATLEQRSSEVTQLDTKPKDDKEKKTATPWLVAAAVAIVAGIGLIVVNQGNEAPSTGQPVAPTATNPPVTSEAAPTTVNQVSDSALTENALASVDAWFDGFNAGDDEAVLGLFAPGVVISDSISGSWTLDDWAMRLAWNTAQGVVFTPQECSANEIDPGVSATVTCSSGNRDALTQAVGAPPVPTNMVAIVTAEGINEIRFDYGQPDFNHVKGPFTIWMLGNHFEIAEAGGVGFGFGSWATVEEAKENGLLTAQYAAEWATYLIENDCTYLDGC